MLTIKQVIRTLYNALIQKLKNHRGNWEQNNPSADDYIKNRPFYTDETKNKICVKERTFIFDSNGVIEANLGYFLIEGETYTVIWDGISYECVARNDGYDDIYIGNQEFASVLMGWDFSETIVSNEPFFIATQANYNYCCIAAVEGTHKISIIQPYVVKIDKKYLPENNNEKVEAAIDDLYDYANYLEYNLFNIPTDTVRYGVNQSLTEVQKTLARTNIGAMADTQLAKVAINGNYDYLSNKPVGDIFYEDVKFEPFRTSTDSERNQKIDKSIFFEKKNYEGLYYIRNNENGTIREYTGTAKLYFIENDSNETKYYYSLQLPSSLFLTVKFMVNLNYTYHNFIWLQAYSTSIEQVDITFKDLAIKKLKQLDPKFLPDGVPVIPVTNDDNGKILSVSNGTWSAADFIWKCNEISFIDQVNGYTYILCMRDGSLVTYCAVKSIEVTTMPTKTEYYAGDSFDPTDMVITTITYDGVTKEINDYTYSTEALTEGQAYVEINYVEAGITHTVSVPIIVKPFTDVLVDFEYTDNGDGTYTITGWKGTYNGEPSTEMIIPNYENIIV